MARNEIYRRHEDGSPWLLSFSGIDGAGKTTQIEKLTAWLVQAELSVTQLEFWDDVATFRSCREGIGHIVFKGEKGVGSPGKPVRRRDKDVQSWYLFPVRASLGFLDALSLRFKVAQVRQRRAADVVILDRYIYDQLANFNLRNRFVRAVVRLLVRLSPHPDVALLLDAEPALACARKPEYPLDFVRRSRKNYFEIGRIAGMDMIAAGTPENVAESIRDVMMRKLCGIRDRPVPQAITNTSD